MQRQPPVPLRQRQGRQRVRVGLVRGVGRRPHAVTVVPVVFVVLLARWWCWCWWYAGAGADGAGAGVSATAAAAVSVSRVPRIVDAHGQVEAEGCG